MKRQSKRAEAFTGKPSLVEIWVSTMGVDELRALLSSVPGVAPAGMFRASEEALRGAVHTYLRIGRLTEAAVRAIKEGKS